MNDSARPPLLLGVGLQKNKRPFMPPAGRVLQYHVISYITRGEGSFTDADGRTSPVSSGAALFQFPNKRHHFDPAPGTRWSEYWVMFDGTRAQECFGPLLPEAAGVYEMEVLAMVIETWEELADVWELRQPGYAEYAEFLLHKILMDFHRARNRLFFLRMDDEVNRLRQEMRAHISEPDFDVAGSAAARHLGYDQLRKRFKRFTGLSPKEYFIQIKMNFAKELLIRPGLTIKEVSRALGFSDPYYFSRLFHRKTGTSPLDFRRRIMPRQRP